MQWYNKTTEGSRELGLSSFSHQLCILEGHLFFFYISTSQNKWVRLNEFSDSFQFCPSKSLGTEWKGSPKLVRPIRTVLQGLNQHSSLCQKRLISQTSNQKANKQLSSSTYQALFQAQERWKEVQVCDPKKSTFYRHPRKHSHTYIQRQASQT